MNFPSLKTLIDGIREGDRILLARAITLVESTRADHQALAGDLLAEVSGEGSAIRVGITGVPGVGKSTLIETLGMQRVEAGQKVAVLAVDPSSSRTGGSILGDKTRMSRLARDPRAFIRPSPTGGTLGGVANRTREALLLCEAAGFDVVLVETVGVGQSELVVAGMTDTFVVLMLAGAGDELQGIKRGLMELADVLAVNKADGDNALPARRAASTYRAALQLLHAHDDWKPRVLTVSGLHAEGIEELWEGVLAHRAAIDLPEKRSGQALRWMWSRVDEGLRTRFRSDPAVLAVLEAIEQSVREGAPPTRAAARLLAAFS